MLHRFSAFQKFTPHPTYHVIIKSDAYYMYRIHICGEMVIILLLYKLDIDNFCIALMF